MVTETRPAAVRSGPSLTVIATLAVGDGRAPTVRVRRHPDAVTVRPLPLSTAAFVIEQEGCARGESR